MSVSNGKTERNKEIFAPNPAVHFGLAAITTAAQQPKPPTFMFPGVELLEDPLVLSLINLQQSGQLLHHRVWN